MSCHVAMAAWKVWLTLLVSINLLVESAAFVCAYHALSMSRQKNIDTIKAGENNIQMIFIIYYSKICDLCKSNTIIMKCKARPMRCRNLWPVHRHPSPRICMHLSLCSPQHHHSVVTDGNARLHILRLVWLVSIYQVSSV